MAVNFPILTNWKEEAWKISGLQWDLKPMTSAEVTVTQRSRVRIPLKPWYSSGFFLPIACNWKIYCDDHSSLLLLSELWSSQLWMQSTQLRREAWKSQDLNGVWTCDLAIPVRRSNQLSYEATDVGSWSFVSSNEPVKNGCEVIYKMFHILNCGFWNQVSYDHPSYERNLSNCV